MLRLVCLISLAGALCAQTRDTASIFGVVDDPQGAAIPGATIKLTSIATAQVRTTTTDEAGRYVFNLLPIGSYQLAVDQPAFRRYERTGILLQANANVKIDIRMEVGDVRTVVSVDAAATQIETQVATLREIVDRARVVELPLNGRDAAQLAMLVPGVTSGNYNTGVAGQDSFSVNGSRSNNVRFTLDGGQNMDNHYNLNVPFPFPDAVEEFSVQTSNMGADHGNSSAAAINIVTKSGTNQLHGTGFWFVRNSEFNATNFFSHQPDRLKRNQAGFTVGGPLIKNKLFAFGGIQQLWLRSAPGSLRAQTLNAAQRQGDFSGSSIILRDRDTGQPFAGNRIPQDRLSPAALKFLTVSPLPGPDGYAPYSTLQPQDGRQYIGRFDYVLNNRQSLLFRGFRNEDTRPLISLPDNILASQRASETPSSSFTLGHTFTVSPSMIAHTQISATHMIESGKSDFPKTFNDFGVKLYAPSNDIQVALTNSGVGFNNPWQRQFKRASEEVIHDWTWTHGGHTVAWGAQFTWGQYNEATLYDASGRFRFDGSFTGFDRADFMLGRFSWFHQTNGEYENRRQFLKGFYFADTWRISRRLSLNLGLRYEPYTFMSDTQDRNQTFDLANYTNGIRSAIFPLAPPGLLYHGDAAPAGYPCGSKIPLQVSCPDNNNFAPRVGFAWDPFGDGKSSVRAGYGLFYDAPLTRVQNNSNNAAPFGYEVQFYEGQFDDPYLGREQLNRYPLTKFTKDTPFPSPLAMYVLDSKWITALTHNWNLTIERQILPDTRLRIGYVGTTASHLMGFYDQNSPIYNPDLTLAQNRADVQGRRPIKGFGQMRRNFHGLRSNYHGLQLSVDKRFSNGFSILGSYTWSKTLDYESVNDGIGGYPGSLPTNFFATHGVADQHVPQRFVTSFVWEMPGARVGSSVLKPLVRDWRLSGIVTLQSGRPFTVAATGDPLAGVDFAARANLVGEGNPVLDSGRSKAARIEAYFDKARFVNAAPNTIGTLGRNALEGPGTLNVDTSLVKRLRFPFFGEGGAGELRLEAFNLFNRTNFSNPVTGITNQNFGRLTSAGSPRILQIAVKILF
ncbi:MAG TPA: carboxypeptidase regulatory-like domain-containing protein [Bryobacteraceae bacterium]|nr:carboxypeptidase regulatory-like domain-containing protein [Bryobacteraceae bacterium]